MKYKLIIFDLDGTVLDTLEDLCDGVNYALQAHNFPKRTIDEVRNFVGNGVKKLILRAVPSGTNEEKSQEVYDTFSKYYKIHCADKTAPYNDIISILKELKKMGISLAVLSNKDDYAVKILCDEYFPNIFDIALGSRSDMQRKPHPDGVEYILNELNFQKSDAVYIGDSDVDIKTAKNANMDCISVSWGFRSYEFLIENGAEIIVNSPNELIKAIT